MRLWRSAEWQRVRSRRGLSILLVGIMLIPSLYAVIFLSSLWDTYGQLDKLPVAIVNQDRAAVVNNQQLTLGDDLTQNLLKKKPLKLTETTAAKAKKGLHDGKYYMTITIPEDFSKNSGTLLNSQPKVSQIKIAQNGGQSFIAEKMTASAAQKIHSKVESSLQQVYSENLLSALQSSKNGFKNGAKGADKLHSGLTQLQGGSAKLASGTDQLASGGQSLANGVQTYTQGVSRAQSGSQTLTNGIGQLQSQLPTLSTGVNQLTTGASRLSTGIQQYTQGVNKAYDGSTQLSAGLSKMQNALNSQDTAQLLSGIKTFQSSLDKLESGLSATNSSESEQAKITASVTNLATQIKSLASIQSKLASTAKAQNLTSQQTQALEQAILPTVSTTTQAMASDLGALTTELNTMKSGTQSLTTLKDSVAQLNNGFGGIASGVTTLVTTSKSGVATLNTGATSLNSGLATLNTNATSLTSGANQLAGGLNTLNQKIPTLNSGVSQLASGSQSLSSGLGQLTANNTSLTNGADQLSSGAAALNSGAKRSQQAVTQVTDGTNTLAQKLADGAIELDVIKTNRANAKALANPVHQKTTNLSSIKNNGTGMTPYMMSVGLFVGMLTMTMIYDFMVVAKKPRNGFRWWLDKQTVIGPVVLAQAVVMLVLLMLVDQLNPVNVVGTFIVAIIMAFSFNQLVVLFNVAFGKLGSGLMLVLMVLQLSASAGTYPIQLSNRFFEAINPYMPMTYSVRALRETISLGGSYASEILILLVIGLTSMVLTWVVYQMKLKHNQLAFAD